MAKAKATCTCGTCGKTFVQERICANRRDADSWEAWAVEHYDECPECWRAAEAARLADKVAVRPALTGTEKQIAWANKIREEILATGRELEAEEPSRYWMDWLISTKRSASWWIDHRFKDCYALIPETAAEYMDSVAPVKEEKKNTMNKTYYFINDGINPDAIYGSSNPVCIDLEEIKRLSRVWGCDLMEHMHEASEGEIAEYGKYDS